VVATGLAFIAAPFIQEIANIPVITIAGVSRSLPGWSMPVSILFGVFLVTTSMHLAKWVGNLHGRYAKQLLVAD